MKRCMRASAPTLTRLSISVSGTATPVSRNIVSHGMRPECIYEQIQ